MYRLLMIVGTLLAVIAAASASAVSILSNAEKIGIPGYSYNYAVSNTAQWKTPFGLGPSIHPLPLVAKTVAPLTTILGPVNYGFGATPAVANLPKMTSHGQWSLPWDPFTHSYGGWVPIAGKPLVKKLYLTILTKQYDPYGNLHKWISEPMPLDGRKIVVKRY